jgi:polar amino acid transport system substrate-binding protein
MKVMDQDSSNNQDNKENKANEDASNMATIPLPVQSSAQQSTNEQSVSNQEVTQVTSRQQKKSAPTMLIILFLIISFVAGLLVAVWYFQDQLQKAKSPVNQSGQTVTQSIPKVIIIGTDATAPPMESVNKQGGLVGYDIDLGYRIANELGVKAEIKNIPWDDLFKALESKRVDMIISSVTINDERKLKYAFSEPYINAGQVIVSRKDYLIKNVEELKGKRISVQKGKTNEKEAFKYTNINMVLSYDGFEDAAKALSEGRSDAMISDLTLAKGFISQYDNLKITSDPFTNDYYGVVLRKDGLELKKKVDDALSVLRVNGMLTDLKQKWLE